MQGRPFRCSPPASAPPDETLRFDKVGLHIGSGCLVVRPTGVASLLRDETPDRVETLLAIAFRKRLSASQSQAVIKTAENSRREDQALANLRLATSRRVRIPHAQRLGERLEPAGVLLDKGMAPNDLLDALDLGRAIEQGSTFGQLTKYDPDQPHVPAGSGRESGRFGSGGAEGPEHDHPDRGGAGSATTTLASASIVLRPAPGPSFLAPASVRRPWRLFRPSLWKSAARRRCSGRSSCRRRTAPRPAVRSPAARASTTSTTGTSACCASRC